MAEEHQNITLDCGIVYARLEAWLVDELELPHCDAMTWAYRIDASECRIELSPLGERTLGNFALEHTQLSIDGDAEAVAGFMKLFTLRFISAGG